MIQTRGNITLLHVMFSGSTEVGKRALLSQLIKLQPSPTALFQPPTAVTTENPSTGVAEKVLPVIVRTVQDEASSSSASELPSASSSAADSSSLSIMGEQL